MVQYTGRFSEGDWVYVADNLGDSVPLNRPSDAPTVRSKKGKRVLIKYANVYLYDRVSRNYCTAYGASGVFFAEDDLLSCAEHKALASLDDRLNKLL